MAHWRIDINGKGLKKGSVEKLIKTLGDQFGDAHIAVTDNTPPKSRAAIYAKAAELVEEGKGEMESLKDELQDWYNNLPEQFQNGEKGEQLQSAIDRLDDVISNLESASVDDAPDFPGMF